MPTIMTHAAAGAAVGATILGARGLPVRFWILAMVCAMLPDADAIGFKLGIPYGSFWGHRGFTHSLVFALVVGIIVATVFFRSTAPIGSRSWFGFTFTFTLITASHALLDMMTSGGMGVALFAPFDNTRYFFPWRPIRVAPIGIAAFFSEWGVRVMKSELLWVWLPATIIVSLTQLLRRLPSSPPGS